MCEKGISEKNSSMGTLTNGSEVFNEFLNECSVTASGDQGSGNRLPNLNFGSKFRVLKRTDQV
jgi:hypothetical protein